MKERTRNRLVLPILIPLGALVAILLAAVGFSRVLLSLSPMAATATALAVALAIMVIAARVAALKQVRASGLASFVGGVAGVTMLAGGIALAALGAGGAAEGEGGAEGVVAPLSASAGAATDGFDQTELIVPADAPFTIDFDNGDPGVPHNVAVYEDEGHTQLIAGGSVITGPAREPLEVEALAAGTYFFRCDVHPTTMTGTVEATAEGGGAGGEEAGTPEGGGEAGGGGPSLVAPAGAALNGFAQTELTIPANAETTLTFDNQDSGVPHDVAIYADDSFATPLFHGEIVTGPTTVEYAIPALQPGTYPFRCDVHPGTMVGTVRVE